ncbi:hypothetical protein LZ575_06010 [Antarcticibacterium sp. 1MA-6-2]|uniref:hypothetical protein n=1 Tax=Antarcticibacterium sp. 1MA-6-2 TaxID=2908210 RepID=UPI001F3B4EEB|nr:hypothetical protein [Antarcticibacterium sp. 1MA-6-2]UJH92132.1 hypothetical protein LZ575_06010 [Antarcticibacterium sp. 1MA-6-2]
MKEQILTQLDYPEQLEKLYRSNKTNFKKEFNTLYSEIKGNPLADFWNERLNYETDDLNRGSARDLIFILVASLLAGIIAKFPAFFGIDEEFFYPRNIGFILFPMLAAWFAWKRKLSSGKIAVIVISLVVGVVYINALPDLPDSDTLTLACIHLLIFLWAILGFAYVGGKRESDEKRLNFLKYNGDLLVISALIGIA